MAILVNFEASQAQLDNGDTGVQLAQVILPYSIRNSEDSTKYLGGQMTLWPSDGIKLSDNTKDWERLALDKIKNMVADAEIYVPDQVVEAPASSADDSVASSEATVASSTQAPVSSAESTVASSAVE